MAEVLKPPTESSQRRTRTVRPFRVRPLVRAAHLYAGLALSVVLFVLAVTGSALTYKEAYWRWAYPELRVAEPGAVAAEELERGIEVAHDRFGDRLRSLKLPEPGVPAYHLYLTDGEAFMTVGDHAVLDTWGPRDRVMSFLFDLHAHLLAGERGERVGGLIGLLGALMVLTGVYLWWPARRRFRWANALPSGWVRRRMIAWHRDLGLLASPILLILCLTGGGIVFYAQAGAILNGLFGDPPLPPEPAPALAAARPAPLPEASLLARIGEELPDARLVFYYPPPPGSGVYGFRLQRPCELHPNGRSYVYLDAAGRTLQRTDACSLPPGERALHAIYPLHAGKAGSDVYKLLVFLGGLALAAVSFSGAVAYGRKLVRN